MLYAKKAVYQSHLLIVEIIILPVIVYSLSLFNKRMVNMGMLRNQMRECMQTQGYSEKTIKLYTCCVKCFSYHFMKSPLEISYQQIEAFFLFLRQEKKSESTIHIYYESLKYFYSMHNMRNRLPHITFTRIGKLPEILCQKEVLQLLANCNSLKYRTIFTLIYSAGLRVSEAANLKLTDIDFERKLIYIQNAKNKKDRYTLLAEETIKLINKYLQIYNPVEYLFYGNDICNKISIDCIQRKFKTLAHDNKISKNIHIHTLRHCFATHLLENGTSIFYIMKLLGHSNIQTTMVYLHMQSLDSLNIKSPIDTYNFTAVSSSASIQYQLVSA